MNLKNLLQTQDLNKVKEQLKNLKEKESKYKANTHRKWILVILGAFVGVFLGFFIPKIWAKLTKSAYSREGLEKVMYENLGNHTINQAITDETLIVAYDYNSQEPRLFSKYFGLLDE